MTQTLITKRMERYHKIYSQIYENPFISKSEIGENTGLAHKTVAKCLDEMDSTVIHGPSISLTPARNYCEYAYFLEVEHPRSACEHIKEFPSVHSVTWAVHDWNLFFTSEKCINVEEVKGFKTCILHKVKGATTTSKVTTLDWDESMKKMRSMHPLQEKSSLKEKAFIVPWQDWEWALYQKFRHNVRAPVTEVLEELGIPREWYTKWASSLSHFGNVHVTFYPQQVKTYLTHDFLFKSDYQKSLVDTLGLLPSTSVFFPVGQYLLARLSVLNRKEMKELYTFIYSMKKKGFFTDFFHAMVVKSKKWIPI